MRRYLSFAVIFFIIVTFTPIVSRAKIYIKIDQFSQEKFPIAVMEFENRTDGKKSIPEKLDYLIQKDLDFTGLFRFIPKKAFLDDPKRSGYTADKIDFANWAVLDAQALLKGWYRVQSKDMVTIEAHLFDVLTRSEIFSKKYFSPKQSIHQTLHKISNEIMFALTGEAGIFDTKIAFIGDRTGNKEIYAMDLDGRNVIRMTSNRSINLSPDWSRDSKKIAFTSFKGGDGSRLYIGDLETKRITDFNRILKGTVIGPVFNPTGDLLAITFTQRYKRGIYLFNPSSKSLRPITKGYAINVSPSFSPDGREIVFASNRSGRVHIYKKNIYSSEREPTRLTFKGIRNVDPAWSPKGDLIAFSGLDTDGYYDIFIMNSDGSGLKRLTYDTRNNEHPSWSPDGRYIIFSSNRTGIFQLYVTRPTAMSEKRPITRTKYNHTMPTWSPRLQ